MDEARREQIYAVVRRVPRGRVATYGEVAELAGLPSGHRQVASAMRGCPEELPWHRILGKQDMRRARIAILDPDLAQHQRRILSAEGVKFDEGGYVRLRDHGWLPR